MRVLAIGNSFTDNASKFIAGIIEAGGLPMDYRKATVGGKTVQFHCEMMESGEARYSGESLGDLIDRGWDAVVLQQQSAMSAQAETWQPWSDKIVARVREKSPDAKIVFYQTWGYRAENPKLETVLGGMTQTEMLDAIKVNCENLSKTYDGGVLPVGEAFRIMQELTGDETGETTRLNDGSSHACPLGEFIAGMIFWSYFTGGDVDNLNLNPAPELIRDADIPTAKRAVKLALGKE